MDSPTRSVVVCDATLSCIRRGEGAHRSRRRGLLSLYSVYYIVRRPSSVWLKQVGDSDLPYLPVCGPGELAMPCKEARHRRDT